VDRKSSRLVMSIALAALIVIAAVALILNGYAG
jgi:hypothetical protein